MFGFKYERIRLFFFWSGYVWNPEILLHLPNQNESFAGFNETKCKNLI